MYKGVKYVQPVRGDQVGAFIRAAQEILDYMGHKPAVQFLRGNPTRVSVTIPNEDKMTFYLLLREEMRKRHPQP